MTDISKIQVGQSSYDIKDGKAARISHTHKTSEITGLSAVATSGSYSDLKGKPSVVTESADGLMSAADKTKLDGIEAGATASADTLTGATVESAGKKGLVPAPAAGDQGKWLRGDGTWAAVTPSGIGAAASSHEHSTADITSGKFSAARFWTANTAKDVMLYAQDGLGAMFVVNANALADAYSIISQMFAPLKSPGLEGTPTAPTAAAGTNSTQIATTEFVSAAIAAASGTAVTVTTSGPWTVIHITSAYALLLSQVSFKPSGWTEWGRDTQYSNLQPAVSWPVTVKGVIYCDAKVQRDSANSFCDAYLNAAPSLTQFPPFYVTSRSGNTSLETTVTVQRVALVKTA